MDRETIKCILTNGYNDDNTFLFHYTSLEACCSIIESRQLRMGNLSSTNDPLEFCGFPGPYFIGDVESADMARKYEEDKEAQNLRNRTVRILCFCQDFTYSELRKITPFINAPMPNFADNLLSKGWARARMWAQYADNHRGTCLVFNKAEFKEQFNKMEKGGVRLIENEITYTNILADFESAMTPEISETNLKEDFSEFYLDEKRLPFLFRKCEDFRDENEYRFCIIDKTLQSLGETVSVDIGDSLKAVILGAKVSPAIKIIPLFSRPIEQFRIQWHFGMPEL